MATEYDLIYRIGVEHSEQGKQALKEFAAEVVGAQERITTAADAIAKQLRKASQAMRKPASGMPPSAAQQPLPAGLTSPGAQRRATDAGSTAETERTADRQRGMRARIALAEREAAAELDAVRKTVRGYTQGEQEKTRAREKGGQSRQPTAPVQPASQPKPAGPIFAGGAVSDPRTAAEFRQAVKTFEQGYAAQQGAAPPQERPVPSPPPPARPTAPQSRPAAAGGEQPSRRAQTAAAEAERDKTARRDAGMQQRVKLAAQEAAREIAEIGKVVEAYKRGEQQKAQAKQQTRQSQQPAGRTPQAPPPPQPAPRPQSQQRSSTQAAASQYARQQAQMTQARQQGAQQRAQIAEREADGEVESRQEVVDAHRQASRQTSQDAANNARQQQQHLQSLQSEYTGMKAQLKGYKDQSREAFLGGLTAAMQLSRGFVALGLSSEESTEKMMRGLVKMQGIVDSVTGSVQGIYQVTKAIDSVTEMMRLRRQASALAARVAQQASVAETAALQAEAAAAGQATTAHAALNAQRSMGSTAASAGITSNAIAGGAASRAAAAPVTRSATESASRAVGSGAAGAGGGVAATGGAGLGATVLLGAGAAASIGAAIASGLSTFGQAQRYGTGGGAEQGSVADRIATAEANTLAKGLRLVGDENSKLRQAIREMPSILRYMTFGAAGRFVRESESLASSQELNERLSEQDASLKANQERNRRQQEAENQFNAEIRAMEDRRRQQREQLQDQTFAATDPRMQNLRDQQTLGAEWMFRQQTDMIGLQQGQDDEALRRGQLQVNRLEQNQRQVQTEMQLRPMQSRLDRIQRNLEAAKAETDRLEQERQKLSTSIDPKDWERLKDVNQQLQQQDQRRVDLSQQRLGLEQQIAEVNKQANQQNLQALQQQLQTSKQIEASAKAAIESAAERFGRMDKGQQRDILRAKGRLDELGDAALAPAERERWERFQTTLKSGGELSESEMKAREQLRRKRQEAMAQQADRSDILRAEQTGLRGDQETARQFFREQARTAGFDEFIGGTAEEQADISLERSVQRELNAKIKQEMEVKVTVESEEEAVVTEVMNQVNAEMDRQTARIRQIINDRWTQSKEAIAKLKDDDLAGRLSS